MTVVPAHFPEKFACLFRPARYKVFYGGRGGAKSWNIARALLLVGVQKGIRVLCVREQQNSIAESVHKLLSDQIEALGLSHLYEIQKTIIICAHTGTTFNFEGIKANVNKIKSYEGVDYVWAEEAALISKNSWDILIPTIRKPGSEIWISFNPENEDDETYKRFVLRRQPNSFVVKVTWRDNPWFPEVLRTEMEECQRTNYDDYLWIWEGNCRRVLDGAVYKHEIRKVIEEDRVTWVPYTKGIPVDVTMDLGRKDYTAIWFRQTVALQRRYIDFLQDHGRDVEFYVTAIQDRGYNIGTTPSTSGWG
jgi:phage terminase large subunit